MIQTTKPFLALCAALTLWCCSDGCENERENKTMAAAPIIDGTEMVHVPACTFAFNAAPGTLRTITGSAGQYQLIQKGFWISREPVTKSLYESVMGEGRWPDAGLSHDDAQAFLDRLYRQTGIPAVLPTEAMYEAALWESALSPQKKGLVLTSDRWSDATQDETVIGTLPIDRRISEGSGDLVTVRKPYERMPDKRFRRTREHLFHICVRQAGEDISAFQRLNDPSVTLRAEFSDGRDETFTVNGVTFKMKAVPGGTLTLGATKEQGKYAEADEKPERSVTVEDYKLSQTEVTRELWAAVMGSLPAGNDATRPHAPVGGLNWYDAQRFTSKLSSLTGRPFRIPSEDEWEYAARGGHRSRGFMFAGSNASADVAVCGRKEERTTLSAAGTLAPNELGLYDMSGNAWEWVRGAHPEGPAVLRGGSYNSRNTACRVSNRQPMAPEIRKATFGLRIAL